MSRNRRLYGCLIAAGLISLAIGVSRAAYATPCPPYGGACFHAQLSAVGSLDLALPGFKTPVITKLDVVPRESKSGSWFGENFVLVVHTRAGKTVRHDFSAAYGEFSVSVAALKTNQSQHQILLVHAQGKGNSSTHYILTIYGLDGAKLAKLFSKKIADYFGPGSMWWYQMQFPNVYIGNSSTPYRGLLLTLHRDPVRDIGDEAVASIPSAQAVCVVWDKDQFREFDNKVCSQVDPR